MIAVTGDLVDGPVGQLQAETAPLAGLHAPLGVYFVFTGNHEYYSGEREWTREITRLGLSVLKNEHVVLRHGGAEIALAGVTDYSAHQPNSAAAAAKAGFDLQISGHTHGGQFLPWNFFVGFFQPLTAGLYRGPMLSIYVSRGTGYWGPPNRFGVAGEITRLRLVPAADR